MLTRRTPHPPSAAILLFGRFNSLIVDFNALFIRFISLFGRIGNFSSHVGDINDLLSRARPPFGP
jgi:hypothetical protein